MVISILCLFAIIPVNSLVPQISLDDSSSPIKKATYYINRNPDSVKYFCRLATLEATETNDYNLLLESVLVEIKSDIKSSNHINARSLCDTAKYIINKYNLNHRQNEVMIYLGNVYYVMGFSSEALEILLNVERKLGDAYLNRDGVDVFYYIGMIYIELGEPDKGIAYLNKSLVIANSVGSESDIFPIYMNIIETLDDADSIRLYLGYVDSLMSNNPRLLYEKTAFRNYQALFSKALGDYQASKRYYIEAIALADNNSFREYSSTLYNNYAYLMMSESKFDSAKIYLDKALQISLEINSLELESTIYDSYGDYYDHIEDYENAYISINLSIEKDILFREQQKVKHSLYLTAIFETEQKEKEILKQENEISQLWIYILAILGILVLAIGVIVYFIQKTSLNKSRLETIKKGRSLEIANAIIRGQDSERKKLAMDLHDGIGARLGALRFIVDGFFSKNDKFEDVSNSISDIHQNVRDLSHRMLPAQLDQLGLSQAIRNLVASINKTRKFTVQFETNIDFRLPEKYEINIYFLTYELINNSIKHSKGSSIFVQLYNDEDLIILSVEDDGVGFDTNTTSPGLGLKNLETRARYLSGSMVVESNDTSTLFVIEIPYPKK